jgi:hypothetical protein
MYVSEEYRFCYGEGNTEDKDHSKDTNKSTGHAQISSGAKSRNGRITVTAVALKTVRAQVGSPWHCYYSSVSDGK